MSILMLCIGCQCKEEMMGCYENKGSSQENLFMISLEVARNLLCLGRIFGKWGGLERWFSLCVQQFWILFSQLVVWGRGMMLLNRCYICM